MTWRVCVITLLLLAACRPGFLGPRSGGRADLEAADRRFESGDLAGAAGLYESYLADGPPGPRTAEVLFRLALIHLAPEGPRADPARGERLLGEIVKNHSGSPYRPLAEALLRWRGELRRLRQQIQELKRIDLDRPRQPSG